MEKVRFLGLDVHKESIAIAVADGDGSAPQDVATIPNEMTALLKRLRRLGAGGKLRCCYEAGPTGFVLQRALSAAGIECIVVAPSLVPRTAGDRIKTDRRDAVKLARFLRSGDLTEVHVPDAATEAMRDLERSRDDAKRAERTARHQLSKFLLRHGRIYEGKTAWTGMHLAWIRSQVFEHEAHNRVLVDSVQAVENATARVERLTKDIIELIESWSLRPLVKALQALRGVQVVTAVILAAELGDFARFASAPALIRETPSPGHAPSHEEKISAALRVTWSAPRPGSDMPAPMTQATRRRPRPDPWRSRGFNGRLAGTADARSIASVEQKDWPTRQPRPCLLHSVRSNSAGQLRGPSF